MYIKDWLDTEVRDRDRSNIYNISEYDTSILFFDQNHSNFSYIFLQFYLKFVEFARDINVDTC
jgi:hypothetical protein